MTLRQLTGLERQRIHDEYTELLDHIAEFRAILADETLVTDIIRTELETLKEKYGDERRTEITGEVKEFEVEDLIADEEMVVTLSHAGYIKRLPMDTYRKAASRRGRNQGGCGKGWRFSGTHLCRHCTSEHSVLYRFGKMLYTESPSNS